MISHHGSYFAVLKLGLAFGVVFTFSWGLCAVIIYPMAGFVSAAIATIIIFCIGFIFGAILGLGLGLHRDEFPPDISAPSNPTSGSDARP